MIAPLSPEWWEARRGKITSSRIRTAVNGTRDGKNALLDRLEAELQPGFMWPPEVNVPALRWGKEQEPKCRRLIDFMYDVDTYEPGLAFHPDVPILGATPDYCLAQSVWPPPVVGEIKCPLLLKHHTKLSMGLKYHRLYSTQVQCHMLVFDADEAWFTSYHPDAPRGAQLYREIVQPQPGLQSHMLTSCDEMARMLKSGSRYGKGVLRSATGVPQLF